MKISERLPILLLLGLLASCTCGRMDLGGGEVDGDQDAGDEDAIEEADSIHGADYFWAPEIENLGEPGWRESQEPWCAQVIFPGMYAYDVWSDPIGVFVLLRENPFWYDGQGFTCPMDCPDGKDAIYVNRGSGWSVFWERSIRFWTNEGTSKVTGITAGPIVTTDNIESYRPIRFIENGTATDQTGTQGAKEVFVVDENLAYAIVSEFSEIETVDWLVYYDGAAWGPLPVDGPPFPVNHLWADAQQLFLAGPRGIVLSLEGSDWKVHDTRTLVDLESIWGFGPEDIWAGGWEGQLLHFDGEAWTAVSWPNRARSEYSHDGAIRGMWGQEGVLFFHTSRQLVVWDGASFTVLLLAEDANGTDLFDINAIWGNSPTELFVAVDDRDEARESCGSYYLLWWDGSEFHWF